MPDLSSPAGDIFQILQSFDYTVMLYDDQGNRVEDPADARRMFAPKGNILVTMLDNGDDSSVKLFTGKGTDIGGILGLLNTIRTACVKYNLLFNVRRYGKVISPKSFNDKNSIKEATSGDYRMNFFEGLYGTSRSSYLKLENARMIVRHNGRIDDSRIGARGRCIESIFVENRDGERFLFPTNNLGPARAMTQHLNHGGSFADRVGSQIGRMAVDYKNLSIASNHIMRHGMQMEEGAVAVREGCRCGMRKMRKTFERMSRANGYLNEAERLRGTSLNEGDEADYAIDPEKIEEMRRVLDTDGSPVSDAVLESVCRASATEDEAGDEEGEPLDEAPHRPKDQAKYAEETVSVFGKKVHASAWNDFRAGKMDLYSTPHLPEGRWVSKSAELAGTLEAIVPMVKDDSLMALLSAVAAELPRVKDPAVASKLRAVAKHAVKAAGLTLNEGLSPKNTVIREFTEWMDRFAPASVLAEDGGSPEFEIDEAGPSDEGDDFGHGGELELSREDIMLPSGDEGDSLTREITPPVETDPVDGEEETADTAYVSRLKTLAGVTSGQSY